LTKILFGKILISTDDNELTLKVVKKANKTTETIAMKSPMLSTALFSVLNKKELFLLRKFLLFFGCFILYWFILMVRIILRRTDPE
jgi:hypothetical protein